MTEPVFNITQFILGIWDLTIKLHNIFLKNLWETNNIYSIHLTSNIIQQIYCEHYRENYNGLNFF
jgi:hypothetical protein